VPFYTKKCVPFSDPRFNTNIVINYHFCTGGFNNIQFHHLFEA